MVTTEEFGQLISEFESFKDLILEEITKTRQELENLRDRISDIEEGLTDSGKTLKKRIG